MSELNLKIKNRKELEEAILREKAKGTSDKEIGQVYNVNLSFIEKVITKNHGVNVSSIKKKKVIKSFYPKNFSLEQTTVWSFKSRGNWATHSGEYRGNWSPYIPRNIILRYSNPGDLVLDYFCGAGTTAVECKLLSRKCIAIDINDKAIELARMNLEFDLSLEEDLFALELDKKIFEPELIIGDARNLSFLSDNSVDLICSHPPYANIIKYTDAKHGDLSFLEINDFLHEMEKVALESFRVLKPGKKCAILIGDTRRKKQVIPLGFKLIDVYLRAGFKLKELVIKRQHNCKTTGFWYANSIKYNFLLLAHEYLPIFEKPLASENPIVHDDRTTYSTFNIKIENFRGRKKLENLETTSVWILPENDIETYIKRNVIDRYAKEENFVIVSFDNTSIKEKSLSINNISKNLGLLYIKSVFDVLREENLDISVFIKKLKEFVEDNLKNLIPHSYVIIQTKDLRMNGFIEPLAKKIIDALIFEHVALKEIIIVTPEKSKSKIERLAQDLEIIHQYLLVYKIEK